MRKLVLAMSLWSGILFGQNIHFSEQIEKYKIEYTVEPQPNACSNCYMITAQILKIESSGKRNIYDDPCYFYLDNDVITPVNKCSVMYICYDKCPDSDAAWSDKIKKEGKNIKWKCDVISIYDLQSERK